MIPDPMSAAAPAIRGDVTPNAADHAHHWVLFQERAAGWVVVAGAEVNQTSRVIRHFAGVGCAASHPVLPAAAPRMPQCDPAHFAS